MVSSLHRGTGTIGTCARQVRDDCISKNTRGGTRDTDADTQPTADVPRVPATLAPHRGQGKGALIFSAPSLSSQVPLRQFSDEGRPPRFLALHSCFLIADSSTNAHAVPS